MSDTIQTLSDLLTALADNTEGAITPAVCRDAILTMQSGVGCLTGLAAEVSSGPSVGDAQVVTGYTSDFSSSDIEADPTAGTLTIQTAGVYLLMGSVATGSADHPSTTDTSVHTLTIRSHPAAGGADPSLASLSWLGYALGYSIQTACLAELAVGDTVYLEMLSNDGAVEAYISHASLTARRVG